MRCQLAQDWRRILTGGKADLIGGRLHSAFHGGGECSGSGSPNDTFGLPQSLLYFSPCEIIMSSAPWECLAQQFKNNLRPAQRHSRAECKMWVAFANPPQFLS
jgi:hypothetical protein